MALFTCVVFSVIFPKIEKLKNFFGGSSAESDSSETPAVDPTATAVPKSGKSQKIISLEMVPSPLSIQPLTFVEKKASHEKYFFAFFAMTLVLSNSH